MLAPIEIEPQIVALMIRHGFKEAVNNLHPQHMTPALLVEWQRFAAKESRK